MEHLLNLYETAMKYAPEEHQATLAELIADIEHDMAQLLWCYEIRDNTYSVIYKDHHAYVRFGSRSTGDTVLNVKGPKVNFNLKIDRQVILKDIEDIFVNFVNLAVGVES